MLRINAPTHCGCLQLLDVEARHLVKLEDPQKPLALLGSVSITLRKVGIPRSRRREVEGKMEGPLGTLRMGQLSSLIHALSLIHYHFSLHSHLAKACKVPSPPRSGT